LTIACQLRCRRTLYFRPRLIIDELDLLDEGEPFDCDVMPLDPDIAPPVAPGARVP